MRDARGHLCHAHGVDEILLGKTVPYFVLGMMGLTLCILAAKFMFHVPIRGSIWILGVVSILYLLVSLCIGLVISSTTKSQFVASEATMLSTFMPSLMLSGFLFDLRSMPGWVRGITYVLPARYYVRCSRRSSWRAMCGASLCPMRRCWAPWLLCSSC